MLPLRPYTLVLALLAPADLRAEPAPIVPAARGGELPPFAFTLSSSPQSPYENELTPTGAVTTVYLWLCHSDLGIPPCVAGLSKAQFGLSPSPGGPIILATNPVFGFSNSGTATCLELTASDCPREARLAAEVVIQALPGRICFAPCDNAEPPEPVMGGEGCGEPGFHPMGWTGLDLGGGWCGTSDCPIIVDSPGACCLPDGSCTDVITECECLSYGGQLQGSFTRCEDAECRVTAVESGMWPGSWGSTKARYGSK
jgi:hypothetical protein